MHQRHRAASPPCYAARPAIHIGPWAADPAAGTASVRGDSAAGAARGSGAANDFDFLHGQWIVGNRRLAETGGGPRGEWTAFDAAHVCRPLPGGLGHLEETTGDGLAASATLRLFDPQRRYWTIHPISAPDGRLQAPLEGRFDSGAGCFVGAGRRRGAAVLVRHVWTLASGQPRFERAHSWDGGDTWVIDWTMDFRRVDWPQ